MKKIITKLLLLVSIICGILTLNSCQKRDLVNNENTQNMIKADLIKNYLFEYDNAKIEEIQIETFLGIYNNSYVAIYSTKYWGVIDWSETIESFVFNYSSCPVLVWKEHKF